MKLQPLVLAVIATMATVSLSGCSKQTTSVTLGPNGLPLVKVGYIGITCEAPLYVAYENGFFKDEGLDVEMVKCEWSKYKDVLALGGFDITHHLIMYLLKPLEQGLNVKFTGGVHTGCLRVQAGKDGPIAKPEDLKGKRIGVPGMGTPPFIFANRVLNAAGLDPGKDVEWKVYPAGELGLALQKGEIDAIADSEPIGTMLIAEGIVKNVADQAKDAPYKDEYCCAVVSNGNWAEAHPDLCAKATRAILRGAKWTQTNPRAAAVLSVDKKYLGSNPELNTTAIGNLNYLPSIQGAETAITKAAVAMKAAGLLNASTDIEELAKKAWLPLPGVTDKWIGELQVPKVADGQIPADQEQRLCAELNITRDNITVATCCAPASKVKTAR